MSALNLDSGPEAQDHSLDIPHSPLYADPYTPPATSRHKITDIQGLDEVSALLGAGARTEYTTVRSGDVRNLKTMKGGCFWDLSALEWSQTRATGNPHFPSSSSVRYRHRLDLTYQARSPQCLCLCLSLNPALASPARLGLWAPTYSPRKVPCNPELPRDTGVPSRAEAHSPQTSLSL